MIDRFEGEFAFLSNFYPSPIQYQGVSYPTVEHFFQAMKTTDRAERLAISRAKTPGQAKKIGRRVALRPEWEDLKEKVMLFALRGKFGGDLRRWLACTAPAHLVEGNHWHDNYWGDCRCRACESPGKNRLGHLLMQVRDEVTL